MLPLIRPNTTVFLDSGSTATELAKIWPDQPNFIFASSMACVMELSKLSNPTIFVPGGELNKYSVSVCGLRAVESVKSVNFDMAVLGVTSYSSDVGFSCGVVMESYLKQAALQLSLRRVLY